MSELNLWEHQKEVLVRARDLTAFAIFHEMGCGKTATLIHVLRAKFNAGKKILKTIIFTPPMVVPQFREEWFKFSKIDKNKVVALQGSQKKRLDVFLEHSKENKVFITNYEALLMKDLYSEFLKWSPQALVFDEGHKLKSISATRSKLAHELANPWDKKNKIKLPKPYTYLLSGTPILNSPIDIFQQFKVMLGGFPHFRGGQFSLIDNFYTFRALYFVDRNKGMPSHVHFPNFQIKTKERDGVDAMAEISSVINRFGSRVEKKDCLDLPEEVSVTVKTGMSAEQLKAYNSMKKDFVAYINDKACVATLAITKALRLMQICSGFAKIEDRLIEDDSAKNIRFKNTPKEETLRELLETITPNAKVLVWACFKDNYDQIKKVCEELKIGFVEVHGEVSDKKKSEAVSRFQNEEEVRVFIGHPGSGGIGLNLVSATYSIFYSRTFSLEHFLQARARNYRAGQTLKVTHYDLVCEGSIEELVLDKLSQKIEIGEKMFSDLAKELERQC